MSLTPSHGSSLLNGECATNQKYSYEARLHQTIADVTHGENSIFFGGKHAANKNNGKHEGLASVTTRAANKF